MQRTLWITTLAGLLATSALSAQELAISDMYGRGVHAYFSGQVHLAYDKLSAAIQAGSRDPRAFYFRGLAYERLGRPQEALTDFRTGAVLEHQDAGAVFGVDRSLERVQGPARLAIERERAAARLGAAQGVVLERQKRSISAQAAVPEVTAPKDTILGEPAADINQLPAAGAMPPVKGEVDRPFGDQGDPNAPGPPPPAAPPRRNTPPPQPAPPPPRPGDANPLEESPLGQPAKPMPPKPMPAGGDPFSAPALTPPKPANPPPAGGDEGGSGRAIGNALKRAFGGFIPEMPQVPAGLPIGGGNAPPPQPPTNPPAANPANDNPFGAPPPAKPAPANNDNPFGKP